MKKALKIIGITLASFIGIILLTVGIACYVVFTPKRLTPIVNQVADSLLTCSHTLEEVNLTLIKTFPDVGLEIKGLNVINPMEGAPSDTVLSIPEMLAGVDIQKALKGDIEIRKFILQDAQANLYIRQDGQTNFDVLNLSTDTVEKDTTSSSWQLRSIHIDDALCINLKHLQLTDDKDSLYANVEDMQCCVQEWKNGFQVDMDAAAVSCTQGNTSWADRLHLTLTAPVSPTDTTYTTLELGDIHLQINEFEINATGSLATPDTWTTGTYDCDLNVNTNPWRISSVIALLPATYQNLIPKEIEADGTIQLQADLNGRYDTITMPTLHTRITLTDAAGHYDQNILPYHFDTIDADIEAFINLNEKRQTRATIHRLYAVTQQTSALIQGQVTEILHNSNNIQLGNPLCHAQAAIRLDMNDANPFLPADKGTKSHVDGTMQGKLNLHCRLNDLRQQNFPAIRLNGDMTIHNLDLVYSDSIQAQAQQLNLTFQTPRDNGKNEIDILSANVKIGINDLHANLLAQSTEAYISGGNLQTTVDWYINNKHRMPDMEAHLDFSHIQAQMDTIRAQADQLKGNARIYGIWKQKNTPHITATLQADTLDAHLGSTLYAATGKIAVQADATYHKDAENVLLQWNPHLKFDLLNGKADIDALKMPLAIPQIKFNYSNHNFLIDTSRIVLGRSDFSLAGEVNHLGKWLKHEGDLVGDLRFTSDHTDVNELMALINRFTADTTVTKTEKTSTPDNDSTHTEPFMVPEHVNMQLKTTIRSADIFNEHLKNLGGMVYVQDGKLILEEMGFICEAAKLQLTAMYRTPRRNHIYVGLDYHMVDIDLQQLIAMIPQLDTLVPMLRSFRGQAQFHIAAETYVDEHYNLKTSTLRGACSVEGKDLVLIDNNTFRKMSKILLFSTKTENKFDSISAQIVAYKDQVTVYPFCVSIDNYMAALGGTHNLDMTFNYHVSLLKPLYIGVDIGGSIDDLKIKATKCRYAKDFRPILHRDTETRSAELRQMVSSSLKKNLKIQSEY